MLLVEDGSGLDDADAYHDAEKFRAWCARRHRSIADDVTDERIEEAIHDATTFIDNQWEYKGQVRRQTQRRNFPRDGLTDRSNRRFDGIVPPNVIDASMEATFLALSEPLFVNADRGGMIVSESVGPISTTYSDSAPAQKLFTVVERLMAGFVRATGRVVRPIPHYAPTTPPQFSVGMHDNAGPGH